MIWLDFDRFLGQLVNIHSFYAQINVFNICILFLPILLLLLTEKRWIFNCIQAFPIKNVLTDHFLIFLKV